MGGIPGFFGPFVDNKIDLDANAKPASKLLSYDNVPVSLSSKSLCIHADEDTSSLKAALMIDEGAAFPSVAKHYGWSHILNHRHFATQILSAWNGISDPQQFQSDVYDILYTQSADSMLSLLKQALIKYHTDEAQVFLKKISNKQHQLCYAHTCNFFTAGNVSDQ